MKDDFSKVVINNGIIRETLTDTMNYKKPYTILNVTTTGPNLSEGDRLLRVFAEHYEYNNEEKKYKAVFTVDHVIEGTKESKALLKKNPLKKELYAMADITEADYIAGNGVTTEDKFKAEFLFFCDAVANSGTIISNNLEATVDGLNQLGVSKWLKDRMYGASAFDQKRVKADLYPAEKDSLEQLAEREFGITINSYKDITTVLHKMVTAYGLNEYLIQENKMLDLQNQQKKALSEEGKKKYVNSNIEGKLDTLLKQGNLISVNAYVGGSNNFGKIYTPNLDKLEKAIRDKKDIVFMQASTTGLTMDDVAIACTLIAMTYKDGAYVPLKTEVNGKQTKCVADMIIEADNNAVMKAREAELKGGKNYPVFHNADIDYDMYINREGTKDRPFLTRDEALLAINNFFKRLQGREYVMVSNASSPVEPNISFSAGYLKKIGKLKEFSMPFIDGVQFLKEYVYQKYNGYRDFGDDIIDFSTWNEENNFSLENFFKHHVPEDSAQELRGSRMRVLFTSNLVMSFANEIYNEKELEAAVEEPEEVKEAVVESVVTEEIEEPYVLPEGFDFTDGYDDGYSDLEEFPEDEGYSSIDEEEEYSEDILDDDSESYSELSEENEFSEEINDDIFSSFASVDEDNDEPDYVNSNYEGFDFQEDDGYSLIEDDDEPNVSYSMSFPEEEQELSEDKFSTTGKITLDFGFNKEPELREKVDDIFSAFEEELSEEENSTEEQLVEEYSEEDYIEDYSEEYTENTELEDDIEEVKDEPAEKYTEKPVEKTYSSTDINNLLACMQVLIEKVSDLTDKVEAQAEAIEALTLQNKSKNRSSNGRPEE